LMKIFHPHQRKHQSISEFEHIPWWEQVNFKWDDDEVWFVLKQHAELDCYSASHWNNSPRVDMSPHSNA
jgi:hypothetical protein